MKEDGSLKNSTPSHKGKIGIYTHERKNAVGKFCLGNEYLIINHFDDPKVWGKEWYVCIDDSGKEMFIEATCFIVKGL